MDGISDSDFKVDFLVEAKELLTNTEQCFLSLEKAQDDPEIIEKIFRLAHNLKGSSKAVGFDELGDFTHTLESFLLKIKNKEIAITDKVISLLLECNDLLISSVDSLRVDLNFKIQDAAISSQLESYLSGQVPSGSHADETKVESAHTDVLISDLIEAPVDSQTGDLQSDVIESKIEAQPYEAVKRKTKVVSVSPAVDETIRVNLSKIDEVLNNIGEIVILQTVMVQQKHHAGTVLMQKTIGEMSKIIKEVQSLSMSLRMLPLRATFQKMQRIVRDTSNSLNKKVNIELQGEETELDKIVLEQLADPLLHLVRNAVDHGIESTEERIQAGKDPVGHITLSASQKTSQIVIEIRDDGKGLDANKLMAKAKEKNIIGENDVLSLEQAHQLVFAPGFSTKEKVTDVSGRGVGMDVVKTNIMQLQGDIQIETEVGKGTCFKIILPLTLAITDGMVVRIGEERYVIPVAQITEFFEPDSKDLTNILSKGNVLNLRGKILPVYSLSKLLKRSHIAPDNASGTLVIAQDLNTSPFAIMVDEIICQQQVVIKNIGEEISGYPGIAGASILGDGKASFILDIFELTKELNKQNLKVQEAI